MLLSSYEEYLDAMKLRAGNNVNLLSNYTVME